MMEVHIIMCFDHIWSKKGKNMMDDRVNREPGLMVNFADKLEIYNDNIRRESQRIIQNLDLCESGKLLNDGAGKLAVDTIKKYIDCILDGTNDNEEIVYKLRESAKHLFQALDLGDKIHGR